jgi:hypothetical protein
MATERSTQDVHSDSPPEWIEDSSSIIEVFQEAPVASEKEGDN